MASFLAPRLLNGRAYLAPKLATIDSPPVQNTTGNLMLLAPSKINGRAYFAPKTTIVDSGAILQVTVSYRYMKRSKLTEVRFA